MATKSAGCHGRAAPDPEFHPNRYGLGRIFQRGAEAVAAPGEFSLAPLLGRSHRCHETSWSYASSTPSHEASRKLSKNNLWPST